MFLDANIFIHIYGANDKKREACLKLLAKVHSGEQGAVTSALVLDEVLFVVSNTRGMEIAEQAWNNMLNFPNLQILPVDEKVLQQVMRFVKAGLEPRDAFHAATMKVNNVETICSYDRGFDNKAGIKRQEP